jgi:hypothetical protein
MPSLQPHRLALGMVRARAFRARPHGRPDLLAYLPAHLGGHPRND